MKWSNTPGRKKLGIRRFESCLPLQKDYMVLIGHYYKMKNSHEILVVTKATDFSVTCEVLGSKKIQAFSLSDFKSNLVYYNP